jgi:hypothetical protein
MSKDNFLEKYITKMNGFKKVREASRELTKNPDNQIIKKYIGTLRKQLKKEASKSLKFKWTWWKYKLFKIKLDKK